jgi:protein-disulfide isomerase
MSNSGVEESEGDLTRKQRREQARGERKALEQAEAARAKRRTRLTQLSVVVAIVVVVIVGIAIATNSGKTTTVKPGTSTANANVAAVSTLLNGIPQNGNVIGDPKAPVTLKYYGDLECPICKDFTLGVLPALIPKYVRTGKLKIEYHALETATREPEVFKNQQVAALAAGKQQRAWNFIELFYHEQGEESSGYVTESYLQGLASQVPGLNLATWTTARSNPALANEVTADAQAANQAGFTGTPSFELGKTGGTLQKLEAGTFTEAAPYETAIEKQLKG